MLKNLAIKLLAFISLVSVASADITVDGIPFAEDVLTVTTTAVGNFGTCFSDGRENIAVVEVKDQAIYFTFTGNTPTADDHTGAVGDLIVLAYASKFKAISQTGTAKLKVTCFKRA